MPKPPAMTGASGSSSPVPTLDFVAAVVPAFLAAIDKVPSKTGLKRYQRLGMLMHIASLEIRKRGEPVSVNEIIEGGEASLNTVYRVTDALVRAGLLERQSWPQPDNHMRGRRYVFRLSGEARRLLNIVPSRSAELRDRTNPPRPPSRKRRS